MSQRTLLLILGATITAGAAYWDLKKDAASNEKRLAEISTQSQADHDVLIKVASGVDQLQRDSRMRIYNDLRPPQSPATKPGN